MMQQRDMAPEKAVWLRRSAYHRHGVPAPCTTRCPARWWPVPRKGFLGKQNCILNTPRVHPAPMGCFLAREVPQQHRGAGCSLLPAWYAQDGMLRMGCSGCLGCCPSSASSRMSIIESRNGLDLVKIIQFQTPATGRDTL